MRIGDPVAEGRHGVSATEMSGCLCCPWLGKAPPDEADGAPCVKGAPDALRAPARASLHQRDELGTLVGVTLISRHGARLPNKGELRPFVDGSAVRREWTQRGAEMLSGESSLASTNMGDVSASERIDPSQRDPSQRGSTTPLENNLTDVGRQQMRTLGRWLVAHPKYGALLRSREPRLEWRSSAAPRVMESGRLIGEGVASALGSGAAAFPHTPVTYTPDDVFRAWDREVSASLSPEYRAHVRAMSEAAEFVARAEEVQGELKAIYEKCECVDATPAERLLWCTYLHLVSECEAYWSLSDPGAAAPSAPSLANGVADPPPTRTAPSDQPHAWRGALHSRLTDDERATVHRHALWVWERRFQGAGEQHQTYLGGRLLSIATRLHAEGTPGQSAADAADGPPTVRVFSCHDYSLLCMLGALGARRYPRPAVGYGAHLLVEHYSSGGSRVLFNPAPFRDDEATPRAAVNGGALSQVAMVSAAGEVCGALPATHSGED